MRDKLNLAERTNTLFEFHRRYRPLAVGYERYDMQADIEHIQGEMARWNYRFEVVELGGATPKVDRIRALMPKFERGNIYFPPTLRRTLYDRSTVDLVDVFVEEEYMAFPVGTHDDMLDALARITDPELPNT